MPCSSYTGYGRHDINFMKEKKTKGNRLVLTPLEPQSRFGDKLLEI